MFNLLFHFPLLQLGLFFPAHSLVTQGWLAWQISRVSKTNQPGMGDVLLVPNASNHSSLARSEVSSQAQGSICVRATPGWKKIMHDSVIF